MTTVFGMESTFFAADSRWTYKNQTKPVDDHKTRKMIKFDDEVAFYAGDEIPIILEQASFLGIIDDDLYLKLWARIEANEEMELIVIKNKCGEIIEGTPHNYLNRVKEPLIYLGSGGEFACDFFYFSSKKPYKSKRGCNVLGAMQYASLKDDATGGGTSYQVWQSGKFLNQIKNGTILPLYEIKDYNSYLEARVNAILKDLNGVQMDDMKRSEHAASVELSSSLSSISRKLGSTRLQKVTLSSAIARLDNRKKRRENVA